MTSLIKPTQENKVKKTAGDDLYAVFEIVDQLTQEIRQEKIEKMRRIKEQYILGIEPDSHEIARAIGQYLKKIT